MKVLLVTNFPPDRQESMLRFGRLLAEGLPALGVETVCIGPEPVLTRFVNNYRYAGWPKLLGYLDKFLLFPNKLRKAIQVHRPDVVHVMDHANSAYARTTAGQAALATCHDLIQVRAARGEIPRHRLGWSGRFFQRWILRHLSRVPDLVCVSRKIHADASRLMQRPATHTHLIYHGLNYPYAPLPDATARARVQALAPHAPLGEAAGFYVNVGGGQWYKNRTGLLEIFAGIVAGSSQPPRLVLVGKPLDAADAEHARALGVDAHLVPLANVSNENLAALYSRARGLIFPSWEEGFGWPVAEAMACGCPVFTSDRAPMTEVGGDAAVYFDPANSPAAARQILAAQPAADAMRARGLAWSTRWATSIMLQHYVRLYRQLAVSAP